jgi:acylphosphatase
MTLTVTRFAPSPTGSLHVGNALSAVINRRDGAVEAWLEGDPDAVERIERWMREGGPRGARVTTIEAVAEQPEGAPGFTIRD